MGIDRHIECFYQWHAFDEIHDAGVQISHHVIINGNTLIKSLKHPALQQARNRQWDQRHQRQTPIK
ncbi:hypothetical protein YPPY25_0999, partial [Yersinia pestis PY-25]